MLTPEGRVKAVVKKFLKNWDVWTDWPVPGGYGKSTLDCQVIQNGCVMWIETKAPDDEPTERQGQMISTLRRYGCRVVVVDTVDLSAECYANMADWMEWTKP